MSLCSRRHRPHSTAATRTNLSAGPNSSPELSSSAPDPPPPPGCQESFVWPGQLPIARPDLIRPDGRRQPGLRSSGPRGSPEKKNAEMCFLSPAPYSTQSQDTKLGRPGTSRRGGEGRVRPRRGGPPGYLRRRAGPASLGRGPPPPAALGLPPHATCAIGPAFSLPLPAVLRQLVRPPVSDSPRAPGDDEGRSGRPAGLYSGNFRLPGAAASNNSPSRVGHCACAARLIGVFCRSEAVASNNSRDMEPEAARAQLSQTAERDTFPPPFPDQGEAEE